MNRKLFCLMAVLSIVAMLMAACGGASTPAPSATSTSSGGAQPTAAPKELTPKELGDQIGAVYVEALREVTKLLENKPAFAEATPKVKDLKEKYVQQLVELGKKREALNTSDRAQVDSAISLALMRIEKEAWYATYTEVSQYYFKQDVNFNTLIASFNIIGQYANFDLLKKQAPAEAQRLGIK
jgi:hypothetical protein